MNDAERVFAFLAVERAPAALVTVTAVTGSSTRNPGAHMAVAADGRFAGSLSGGCIEAAVVAEAQAAIRAGAPRRVRFGAGSPLIDIRLPCGGAVDLLISPLPSSGFAAAVSHAFAARAPVVLTLPTDSSEPRIDAHAPAWRTAAAPGAFRVAHLPPLRIVIAGHGAAVEQLDRQARAFGAATRVLTPDAALAARLTAAGADIVCLESSRQPVDLAADEWSAVAFLFHDHDWEPRLIARALDCDAFYIGAMGSRATHRARLEMLAAAGVAGAERIVSPIGLIPSSRDPQTLALSALAQIVAAHQAATARPDITDTLQASG